MKLQIERTYVEELVGAFPHLEPLQDQLRFGNKAEVPFEQLSKNELAFLGNLYEQAGPHMQGRAAQIITLHKALNDDELRYTADDLEALVSDVARYLVDGAIQGWLFRANSEGKPLAYLITRLDYMPPGEEEAGRIIIEVKANSKGKIAIENLTIRSRDLEGKTISEIFASKGYFKETEELVQAYDESANRYFDWRAQYGHQFSGQGMGYVADDPTATHRNTDWSRKSAVV